MTRLHNGILVFSLLLLSASPFQASARAPQSSRLTPEVATGSKSVFSAAFDAMMADPANVDKTIRYSKAAIAIGDYESAIPPLEKLLVMNPAQPDVRLEVGVLYYLLNSYAVARGYLSDAKNDPTASPETVRRAETYLAKL